MLNDKQSKSKSKSGDDGWWAFAAFGGVDVGHRGVIGLFDQGYSGLSARQHHCTCTCTCTLHLLTKA